MSILLLLVQNIIPIAGSGKLFTVVTYKKDETIKSKRFFLTYYILHTHTLLL
jgi:hypothetical protein